MFRSKMKILPLKQVRGLLMLLLLSVLALSAGCATSPTFRNPQMDFGSLQTVGVMPLSNLSRDTQAGERVRDSLVASILATGAMYVIPPGEVLRGMIAAGMVNPSIPNQDEVVKICKVLKVDGIITGTVREYGEMRSGSASANVLSMSLQLFEGQTGKVVWSGATTQGGIGITDRLFGGGGESMNVVTEKAINDLLGKLFQ